MTRREIVGRYRGSVMGILWSFFNPVFMLTIYTFVFSVVFKAKWVAASDSKTEFAMILFAGLIVFNLFSETVTRAPSLILSNVNYVKKVVFPLEILPVVSILSSCFHALVSIGVLILFRLIVGSGFSLTTALFPIIIAPLLLLSLGISWFLAALGVYLRDVSQTIGLAMTALMFLSPIFFPVTSLPEKYRVLVYLNPLSFIIEQGREVLIFSHLPDWGGLLIFSAFSCVTALLGFAWFQKARTGFADVL
ncbi:MAG: ABC transporter permease [Steroidobacteraceae bacterium]|nr:ABC transporter permease [Deltaproteobacteria bacterium]